MFSKAIISLLVLLGLLPKGKSTAIDWLILLLWLALTAGLAGFHMFYINISQAVYTFNNLTFLRLMLFVSTEMMPSFLGIGSVISLSTSQKRYPYLYQVGMLKLPRHSLLLLIALTSIGWMTYEETNYFANNDTMFEFGVSAAWAIVNTALGSSSLFIVGLAAAIFQQETTKLNRLDIVEDVKLASSAAENLLHHHRSLLHFMSPLLFTLITAYTPLLMVGSYYLLVGSGGAAGLPPKFMASVLSSSFLSMLYVCLVIDECSTSLATVTTNLRYRVFKKICGFPQIHTCIYEYSVFLPLTVLTLFYCTKTEDDFISNIINFSGFFFKASIFFYSLNCNSFPT